MSTVNTTYTTPANYTYDSDVIEVTGGQAQLKLKESAPAEFIQNMDNTTRDASTYESDKVEWDGTKVQKKLNDETGLTFNQPFDSSVGFTFDAAKSEITAGQLQQKDLLPTNSVNWATYTSLKDLNYSLSGSLVATDNGTPTITGNKLDCTGFTANGVYYDNAALAALADEGSIVVKYTPNYTTAPAGNINILQLSQPGGGNNNRITMTNSPSGNNLRLFVYDATGASIHSAYIVIGFPAVSGTTYEIKLTWKASTGVMSILIDGAAVGSTPATIFTRTNTATRLSVGATPTVYNLADGSFEDIICKTGFNNATYTPGYTLPENRYTEDLITYPAFTYSGLGAIQAFTNISATQTGINKFNVNDQYYSGGWVASDNTRTQMNTIAEILANIATLPASDTVTLKQRTLDSTTQLSISDITLTYTGQGYLASNIILPELEYTGVGTLQAFDSFATTDSGSPRFTIQIGRSGNFLYWTGAAWVTSDGTFAQANDATTFNANVGSLAIVGEVYGQFTAHFDNSANLMSLTQLIATVSGQGYAATSPTIYKTAGDTINTLQLNSFTETSGASTTGNIYYQLSADGTIWEYWDGAAWVTAVGATDYNTAAEIAADIRSYLGSGTKTIYVKAFLVSDGAQPVVVENLAITYVKNFCCNLRGYFVLPSNCAKTSLDLKRGNPYNFQLLIKDTNDVVVTDLALADSIKLTIKASSLDQNEQAIIYKDLSDGVAVNVPEIGYITFDLESGDTDISADVYFIGVQISWGSDKEEIDLSFNGKIIDTTTIQQDVVRS